MELRVYINGELLEDIPNGLDSFAKEFVLDPDLFGIYAVSTFDLVFVGDGYCKLKEFFENVETCSIDITIQQKCNKAWKNIFIGIIEVGSIKINESEVTATCEVQDNSPLALISRNADVTIDLETTKDIFDGTITPATFGNYIIGTPTNNAAYSTYGVNWQDVFRVVLEGITGATVNVSSTYLTTTALPTIYELTYTGDLADITSTTILFKNFQGNTQTVVANVQVGLPHLSEVAKRLLSSTQFLNTNSGILQTMEKNDDYRNFFKSEVNGGLKKVTIYSNLPIEIISATADSIGAPITIAITKTQEFTDGGNNPTLFNYNSLKGQNTSPYLFVTTFKDLMELFNKEYNVLFTAKYNSQNEIDFRIEHASYFFGGDVNLTFNDADDLNVEYSEDFSFSKISLGDSISTTLANKNVTLTTDFCALQNTFDATTSVNIGSVKIWQDLASTYEDGSEDVLYMLDNFAVMHDIQWTNDNYVITTPFDGYVYNLYLTNWHKAYRHFMKFKNDLVGVVPYFDFDSINYNIRLTNTSLIRLYKAYNFNEVMTSDEFDALSDNIIDKAQFKKTNDTTYREGIITSVRYNYNSGEAEITILGR